MDETRLAAQIQSVSGGLTTQTLTITVPAGTIWKLLEIVASHDDPAGVVAYWIIAGEGGESIIVDVGALGVNIRTRLGSAYSLPILLLPTWSVTISASGALAAGKKWSAFYHVSKLRGVPPGSYL